jgi:hypothetical protein
MGNDSADAPFREQAIARILRRDQNNVELASQGPMLKAVIEQMELRAKFRFGEAPRSAAILPDDHRDLQFACNQKRFVAELVRQPCGVHQMNAL